MHVYHCFSGVDPHMINERIQSDKVSEMKQPHVTKVLISLKHGLNSWYISFTIMIHIRVLIVFILRNCIELHKPYLQNLHSVAMKKGCTNNMSGVFRMSSCFFHGYVLKCQFQVSIFNCWRLCVNPIYIHPTL
jgi:hypothetical protein